MTPFNWAGPLAGAFGSGQSDPFSALSNAVLTSGHPSWGQSAGPLTGGFAGPAPAPGNFASDVAPAAWSSQGGSVGSPAPAGGGFDWTQLFNSLMQNASFNRGSSGMFGGSGSSFGSGLALFGGNSGMYSR